MQSDPAPGPPAHDIAMWGAPGSGKTTLLAALNIALMRRRDDWKIIGSDAASSDYLIERTNALSSGRVFPEASQSLEHYRWTLVGPTERHKRRWWRRLRPAPPLKIGISMVDAPGGLFSAAPLRTGNGSGGVDDPRRRLMDNLVKSRGLVFLFDPIREFELGDAFNHLHPPLTRLAEKMLETGELRDGKLPHHVAVCITKFDDPRVLETAEKLNLLDPAPDDEYGFPRVSSEDARDLFRALCEVSASGNADMVVNALDQFFDRTRVEFFVTSSIGFFVRPQTKTFDWHDYQNLLPEAGKDLRIRGQVHPINVVEPMLWLGQRLASGGSR
ncbi:hypothetical protein [Microbispora sp. H10836]|uniref:hypothetical protein n=1 Tax=Microbispora sp. H10836 TaxID=2729106 RepID=UPI00147323A8|nr:hypothetical protein [Microbispora sp. H10836]